MDCNGRDLIDLKKKREKEIILQLNDELDALQWLLYAEHKHKVLVVLQAMDTAGKDGVIRHVFKGVNPQGTRVASFKAPTALELDHDYLWRVHPQVPGKGEIVIFNRSHYEDVLITRVHELVPRAVWHKRYQQINDFERMLSEEGVTILKFFLHIDKAEQGQRLRGRLADPHKNWKFSVNDVKERALWDKYMQAYEEAIHATGTKWAPWYIIPANKKWYRDLVISLIIIDKLTQLRMQFPRPAEKIEPKVIF
jgi:PPK2 family polyphosphate:nucleotide phosphotransferase